ncbi:phosphonate C-P lyase system protein PhnH [Ahrensia marina]|uniref:Protein phnH n=1 Tax=Ahrensia marina TaxID=1514904 RepID=A0A0N0E8Q0_9HYPH|nr:phosphonate C-P lyase system protein PhnH [Ahrensia marina]KPB02611.1 protein phnH [Ahrensia marina]
MQELQATIEDNALEGGFREPVFDAQKVFNAIMNAMARPGTIADLPELTTAPQPFSNTTAAIITALCDADTVLWLDEVAAQNEALKEWITFHTAAPQKQQKSEAMFAVLTDKNMSLELADFAQGSQEYPDRSTTLIIQVEKLEAGRGLSLSGPGIKDTCALDIQGLPEEFLDQWRQNNARFPCGVDVILVSETSLACLPRTTKISQGAI